MRFLLWIFPLSLLMAESNELFVDLRNPTYRDGIIYTRDGGVIRNQDIRVQARTIQYIRKDGQHRIEAEGDLLIQYKGRIYVGSELEYDFNQQSGVVYQGKTFSSIWYVGGDEIRLNPDGSYKVCNAFITTCENQDSSWDLHAKRVNVFKNEKVEAKKVRFRLFKIPAMWLPSFKLNLKKFKEPIFRYNINWDKGQGPRASIRYQLYSWEEFALYGRLDYRLRTGWGGALETEYFPPNSNTTFVTRNYLATDRLETAPDKMRRYRVQGAYHTKSSSERTSFILTWDKYSDVRMPSDFRSDDFEVNTAKKTLLYVDRRDTDLLTSFKIRPRVNAFESIKQDLPSFFFSARPLELGSTGIISSNGLKASYVDFVYSDQLIEHLSSYHSARIDFRPKLYRPFYLGPLTLTPQIGAIGIYYNNSPSSHQKGLGLLTYGARLESRAWRQYSYYKHQIEPYLDFTSLSHPTTSPNDHYIFSIQDGFNQINQLQGGLRNLLFSKKRPGQEASFTSNLYANAYFADFAIPQLIPKLYLDLAWHLPSLHFTWRNCWNFQNQVLDYSNARCQWTFSENAAFSLEGRYRSRFDWRKADHENFLLDVTRSQSELLLSPLSDRRITFLTHLFVRLTPLWECHIRSHHGFYRLGEEPYNEIKVDLYTWLSSVLKLRISYSHTDKDDRVTAGLSLVKK